MVARQAAQIMRLVQEKEALESQSHDAKVGDNMISRNARPRDLAPSACILYLSSQEVARLHLKGGTAKLKRMLHTTTRSRPFACLAFTGGDC